MGGVPPILFSSVGPLHKLINWYCGVTKRELVKNPLPWPSLHYNQHVNLPTCNIVSPWRGGGRHDRVARLGGAARRGLHEKSLLELGDAGADVERENGL